MTAVPLWELSKDEFELSIERLGDEGDVVELESCRWVLLEFILHFIFILNIRFTYHKYNLKEYAKFISLN